VFPWIHAQQTLRRGFFLAVRERHRIFHNFERKQIKLQGDVQSNGYSNPRISNSRKQRVPYMCMIVLFSAVLENSAVHPSVVHAGWTYSPNGNLTARPPPKRNRQGSALNLGKELKPWHSTLTSASDWRLWGLHVVGYSVERDWCSSADLRKPRSGNSRIQH
jgi:hypothetical protein